MSGELIDDLIAEVKGRELAEVHIPKGRNSLEWLQRVRDDESLPLATRMRAAAIAIQYESPKLAVTAHIAENDIGTRLEQAIERSRNASKLIEAKPIQYATTSDLNNK